MYTFVIYSTFTTTHNLASWWHFFYWGGNIERNVESLVIILSSSFLASLIPLSIVALTRLLWSSLTYTWNNNLRFSVTINFYLQKIIDNCWLHNLWMMHNSVIKRLLYMFINFLINFSLLFQCLWCSSIFNCPVFTFSSSNLKVSSFVLLQKC